MYSGMVGSKYIDHERIETEKEMHEPCILFGGKLFAVAISVPTCATVPYLASHFEIVIVLMKRFGMK